MVVLTDIKIGESARITNLSDLTIIVRRRLIDLGIYEGVCVKVSRLMPFGGPYILEFSGHCIGIRKKEAYMIKVEKYE